LKNYNDSKKNVNELSTEKWIDDEFTQFVDEISQTLEKEKIVLSDNVDLVDLMDDAFLYIGENWKGYEHRMSFKDIKRAYLDNNLTRQDIVKNMSDGLDTIVGKHGIRLSGGQRQRLSIARMIIANPAVVIFDESTSALDVHTEVKLFSELEEFLKEKTVITIAHRLSTVKNADMIYVIDDGKLVQSGNHKELEEKEGHYLEFVKKQLI
jgi:ABC-type bacteriocin/lantibiotic exporter with double-glycine peptidase domain